MEPTPKHSYAFQPHQKGSALKSHEKIVVMNVLHKLQESNPRDSTVELWRKTSHLTGVSVSSIKRMQKEFQNKGSFSTLGKKRPARRGKATRLQKFDDRTLSALRRKVHSIFLQNEIPTVTKVVNVINADADLPDLSVDTARRLLHDLGFDYKKMSRHSMLVEKGDIQLWRRKYLRLIRHFRNEGKTIYYTDETWLNIGPHSQLTLWQDTSVKRPNGLPKSPTRLIITHAGSEKGFVEGTLDVFEGGKEKGVDHHDEMNADYYEKWFKEKLLPNLDANSVIVCDNAPHHSVCMEDVPNDSTSKDDIRRWLTSKGIPWDFDMLRVELMVLVSDVRSTYEEYRIDSLARLHGHTVLRLPPFHCQLNPIEHVWSIVKGKVAAASSAGKDKEVEQLAREAIGSISSEVWQHCVGYVINEEELLWQLDLMIDNVVENIMTDFDPDSNETAGDNTSSDEAMSS